MQDFLVKRRVNKELIQRIDTKLGKQSGQIEWVWLNKNDDIILLESKAISLKQNLNFTNNLADYNLFPDLYWLYDATLVKQIGVLETDGLTKKLQLKLEKDRDFLQEFMLSVLDFKLRRSMRISPEQVLLIKKFNLEKVFFETGIAGVKNPQIIKCLHSHYAHFLASKGANSIGRYLAENHNLQSFGF